MRDGGVGVVVWDGGVDEGCRVGVVLCSRRVSRGRKERWKDKKKKKRTTTFNAGKF